MNSILECKNIYMSFNKKADFLGAEKKILVIRNVNLNILEGEINVIVGESGCGKTTMGRIITGLLKPTSGEIIYKGKPAYNLLGVSNEKFRKEVQFIQQDSYAALNPVRTIYQSLYAPIKRHNKKWTDNQIKDRIIELMELVELKPYDQFVYKFPHQLSGGQRQRILMARAVSLNPSLIVADEPVSMIDVSLRLSILNLMKKLNETLNISFIYITHDLATSRFIGDNGIINVMYLGEIVENGPLKEVVFSPKHPYTRALIQAIPDIDPRISKNQKDIEIKTMEIGKLENRKEGCPFYPRCIYGVKECIDNAIEYTTINNTKIKCSQLVRMEKKNEI